MPKIIVLSDRTEYSRTISNLSVSHVTLIVVDSGAVRWQTTWTGTTDSVYHIHINGSSCFYQLITNSW